MSIEYEYKYVKGGVPFVEGIEPAEVDDCFRVVAELFTLEWLQQVGGILQRLWHAPYALATAEIYALGYALREMLRIDRKFVLEKIALIKSTNRNDVNGALFEVFALSAFGLHYPVKPAKHNQAGYDGVIQLSEKQAINLSIKNYSISAHHLEFMIKGSIVNGLVQKYVAQFNCRPVEVIINNKRTYPSAADWQDLTDNVHGAFIEYNKAGKAFMRFEIGDWSIILQELTPNPGKLADRPHSYTLIISSPFHKNEEQNLHSKLDDALANLLKHQPNESTEVKNCVVVHLPQIANRKNCEKWVRDYFNQFPKKQISAVLLIQPLVVTTEKGKVQYTSIGQSLITRPSIDEEFKGFLPLKFTMPIGVSEESFAEPQIFIREKGDSGYVINLSNHYVYQQGHHYYNAELIDGAYEVHITKIASGIFRHTVFEGIEVSGEHELVDKLELL